MARTLPDGWRALSGSGAAQRKIDTLHRLATGLSDSYHVYHAVHWTSLSQGLAVFGDIDFVIVNGCGQLLLIDQHSGLLEADASGLVKRYPGRTVQVSVRLAHQAESLRHRLEAALDGPVSIHVMLYCPDHRVLDAHTAGLTPEHVVDASRRDQLVDVITRLLPDHSPTRDADPVHRFLAEIVRLAPDVSAMVGQAQALVTRLGDGLIGWVSGFTVRPWRLRVVASAGAGKSQLALAEYQRTLARGGRPLLVCFNRPLADRLAAIVPPGGMVATFHHLCVHRIRAAGSTPPALRGDGFNRLIERAAALPVPESLRFDMLIVDEGQDFAPEWVALLWQHARPQARRLWLEDPLQRLYDRAPVVLDDWPSLRLRSNCRSPRAIVRMLNALLPPDERVVARSPLDTPALSLIEHDDDDDGVAAIKQAIRSAYASGFRHQDVALVSFRGRESSTLCRRDRIGPHRLRHFTGRHDLAGDPEFTEGELLVESVYRFKGQSAPFVILAEVDFVELDDATLRKLFVGATRASMRLTLVTSRRAARLLAPALAEARDGGNHGDGQTDTIEPS